MTSQSFDASELPLLGGEPFAVEFANTFYDSDTERIDAFQSPGCNSRAWFVAMEDNKGILLLPDLSDAILSDLRTVRDAKPARCLGKRSMR